MRICWPTFKPANFVGNTSAAKPPKGRAPASSNDRCSGISANVAVSVKAMYSADAPPLEVIPKTRWRGTKLFTSEPTASMIRANSLPRRMLRGRTSPKIMRAGKAVIPGKTAARIRQSLVFTALAWRRIRSSFGFDVGRGTSSTRMTSGRPYRSYVRAFIVDYPKVTTRSFVLVELGAWYSHYFSESERDQQNAPKHALIHRFCRPCPCQGLRGRTEQVRGRATGLHRAAA